MPSPDEVLEYWDQQRKIYRKNHPGDPFLAGKLSRERIINEEELDILLPMCRREYTPINIFELQGRRIMKWFKTIFSKET